MDRLAYGPSGRPWRRHTFGGYGVRAVLVNLLTWLFFFAVSAANPAEARRLIAFGDSLTAGYGLPREAAFPARLEAALRRTGLTIEVVNAGVSGETTAGGLARLDWALGGEPPEFAVVELGANDALRGLDPAAAFANLDKIIARLKGRGVKVLIAGMYAPGNFGRAYADAFNAVFPRLAEKHGIPLYPFFLDGVAGEPALNQADGIHPNARGVELIVERILPYVERLLDGH
ncbi:MAG: arylesterase [Proteobacteria bacterium]|nr:arylesterase [Pseudomonadota bacterium]